CRTDLHDPRADETSLAALSLDPADSFTQRCRGWTLVASRRAPEALTHAEEALRLSPHEVEGFVLLAEIHLRTAKYDDAARAAETALAIAPGHATAHRQRAVALSHLDRLD